MAFGGLSLECRHPCYFLSLHCHGTPDPEKQTVVFMDLPVIAFRQFPLLGQLLPQN